MLFNKEVSLSQPSAPLLAGWQWLYEFIATFPGVRSVGMGQVWSAPPPREIPEVVFTEYYTTTRLVCFTGRQLQLMTIGFTTSGQQKGFRLKLAESLVDHSVEIREVLHRGESVEDQLDDVEPDFGDFDEVDPEEFEGGEAMTNPVWTHPKLEDGRQAWLPSSLAFIQWLLKTYTQIHRVTVGSIKAYDGIYQVPEFRYNAKQQRMEIWFYEGEQYQEFFVTASHTHELEQSLLKAIQRGECPLPPKPGNLPVTPVTLGGRSPAIPEVPTERSVAQLPVVNLTNKQADAYELLTHLHQSSNPFPATIILAEHYKSAAGGSMERQLATATASNRVMELQRKELLVVDGTLGSSRTKLYRRVSATIQRVSAKRGQSEPIQRVSSTPHTPKITSDPVAPEVRSHDNGTALSGFPMVAPEVVLEPPAVEPLISEPFTPAEPARDSAPAFAESLSAEVLEDGGILSGYSLDGLMALMTVAINRLRALGWEVEPVRISRKIG
jgi:hypothetical protein